MKCDLFITLDFPPALGGVARYYAQFLETLRERQWVVVAPPGVPSGPLPEAPHVRIVRRRLLAPMFIWPRWLPLLWHTFLAVVRLKPRLVHVGQLLPVGTVAWLLGRWFHVPYVVYVHGLDLLRAEEHPRRKRLAARILQNAVCVVANSNHTKERVLRFGVTHDHIQVVLPGTALHTVSVSQDARDEHRRQFNLEGVFLLLTVCRLVPRKGVATVLGSVARLVQKYPRLAYVIVGDGPDRPRLEAHASTLGIRDRVHFVGRQAERALPLWYASCDAFILVPTADHGRDVEGFGIVFLEAAAFQKPAIGSWSGGVAEAVKHEKTGLLVPTDDVEATARTIERLMTDSTMARQLGEEARRDLEATATWPKRVETFRHWLARTFPV